MNDNTERQERTRILILCCGNPSRGDDGLGAKAAEAIGAWGISCVTIENDFQLQIEYAADIATHDVVLFVDADRSCDAPYGFRRVEIDPAGLRGTITFSTHSATPEALLCLADSQFGCCADAYAIGIRGYVFDDFVEGLSEAATRNLQEALAFIKGLLESLSFEEVLAACAPPSASVEQEIDV